MIQLTENLYLFPFEMGRYHEKHAFTNCLSMDMIETSDGFVDLTIDESIEHAKTMKFPDPMVIYADAEKFSEILTSFLNYIGLNHPKVYTFLNDVYSCTAFRYYEVDSSFKRIDFSDHFKQSEEIKQFSWGSSRLGLDWAIVLESEDAEERMEVLSKLCYDEELKSPNRGIAINLDEEGNISIIKKKRNLNYDKNANKLDDFLHARKHYLSLILDMDLLNTYLLMFAAELRSLRDSC